MTSRDRFGMTWRADNGIRWYGGQVTCTNSEHYEGREYSALMHKVQQVGNYFNYTPLQYHRVARDKTMRPKMWKPGDNLSSVVTNGSQSASSTLRISGLPSGYVLSRGDYISFPIGGIHRLYQVSDPVTAPSNGIASVSLNMPLTVGGLPPAGTAVSLIAPQVTCSYVDGSFSGITDNIAHSEGFKFSFQQVFRA